ncbi:MAG TPA: alpha/beta hydrolase [Bacillales bacterium]|nr:alpha/beta hydrolase [Bacillales bacterium]
MCYLKRRFKLDEQWSFLHLPEKPNGFAVMVLGDTNHYVHEDSSLWEEQEGRRHLLDSLLSEGYTVFYSHLYGKHWGNSKACRLAEELVHLMLKQEPLNSTIHVLAEGMGALTALRLMEKGNPAIRSAAFINPCLDLGAYIKEVKETRWFYKRLLQQISEAYKTPLPSVYKVIEKTPSLSDYQARVPVKIWHSTGRTVFPFYVHSRPYAKTRDELGSPIKLLLHVPERQFHYSEAICRFFRENEKNL